METLLGAVSVGTRKNFLFKCLRTTYGLSLLQNRIGPRQFNFNCRLEIFLSTFVKMTDFQSIKDSTDIFSSAKNFPLMRLSKHSRIYGLWFPIIRILQKFFILDYVNLQL